MNSIRHVIAAISLISCFAAPAYGNPVTVAIQADWCKRLTPRLPGVSAAVCQNSALAPTGALSLKGFPILARDVPPHKGGNDDGAKEPVRILLLGGIHGDELTSSAIVFRWLKWIQGPLARDFHWKIAPVINPDGLLATSPSRVNANGVDLNRNFPMPNWTREAPNYWVKATGSDPRRFPGSAPLSEPESRWVNDEIVRFRPHVIVSIHAPFGLLDFDGPYKPPRRFGRLLLNPIGVYPGSLGKYGGFQMKVPIITIELPNARALPSDAEMQRIWQDMLTWIRRNVPGQPPIMDPAPSTLVPTSMGR